MLWRLWNAGKSALAEATAAGEGAFSLKLSFAELKKERDEPSTKDATNSRCRSSTSPLAVVLVVKNSSRTPCAVPNPPANADVTATYILDATSGIKKGG